MDCAEDLTLADLAGAEFGARLTSVGALDGPREGSLKITDTPDIPLSTCIRFEEFEAGDTVSQIDAGLTTVAVAGDRDGSGPENDAMVFDADAPPGDVSGGDPDLLAGDGNVLILTEDGDASDPDDAAQGGTFTFDFADLVNLDSPDIIDTEEGGPIEAFGSDGTSLGTVDIPEVADGVLQTIDLGQFDGVDELMVAFDGSGGLDDLCFGLG